MMKKAKLAIALLLIGMLAGLMLPSKWRATLSKPLAAGLGWLSEHMPDE